MRAQDFWQTLQSRTRVAAARCADLLHLGHTQTPAPPRRTHSRSDGNLRSEGPRILLLTSSLGCGHALYASDRVLFALFCRPCAENERGIARGVRAKLALMAWCWARLVRRLDALLREFEPGAIVSTQMIPAALVSSVKQRRGLDIPSIAVPTDFGVHDFWVQPGTDAYCVAHESLTDLPESLDRMRVHVTGIPLMPEFAHPLEPMAARGALGLTGQAPVTLVLGGGLGLGVDAATESLLNSRVDARVVVLIWPQSSGARQARRAVGVQARAWTLGQRTGAAQIAGVVHRLIAQRGSKTLPKAASESRVSKRSL